MAPFLFGSQDRAIIIKRPLALPILLRGLREEAQDVARNVSTAQ